ncbi:hypothetical protein [Porticoccus sp.]
MARNGEAGLTFRPCHYNQTRRLGQILLEIAATDNGALFITTFRNTGNSNKLLSELNLNIAVLGMNEQTQVKLGENRGKSLHHDFAARVLQKHSATEGKISNDDATDRMQISWHGSLGLSHCSECAVAAWVSHRKNSRPFRPPVVT